MLHLLPTAIHLIIPSFIPLCSCAFNLKTEMDWLHCRRTDFIFHRASFLAVPIPYSLVQKPGKRATNKVLRAVDKVNLFRIFSLISLTEAIFYCVLFPIKGIPSSSSAGNGVYLVIQFHYFTRLYIMVVFSFFYSPLFLFLPSVALGLCECPLYMAA